MNKIIKKILSATIIFGLLLINSIAYGSDHFAVISPSSKTITPGDDVKLVISTSGTGVMKVLLPSGTSYSSTDTGGITPIQEGGNLYFGFTGATKHSAFTIKTDENVNSFDGKWAFSGGTAFSSPYSNYSYDVLADAFTVNVTRNPKVKSVKCFDSENVNGKYDKMEIDFDKDLDTSSNPSGFSILEISCNSGFGFTGSLSFSGSRAVIADLSECSNFDSGFTPKISYSAGNIKDGSGNSLQNFTDFFCEDLANPYISTNSQISIPDNYSIQIDFSESLIPSSTGAISLETSTGVTVNGSASRITSIDNKYDSLVFTPSENLDSSKNYILKITNAEDWSGNKISKDIALSVNSSDSEAPVGAPLASGSGILILGGDSTAVTSVSLQISAIDNNGISGMEMMISNNSDFSSAEWENYKTTKGVWNLISGDGEKTVYIKFRDSAGNVSGIYSDKVNLKMGNSYVNFDGNTAIYTDSSSFTATGSCNYISETGSVISTDLSFYVNSTQNGTGTCTNKVWSHEFTGLTDTDNVLKVIYTDSGSILSNKIVTKPFSTGTWSYSKPCPTACGSSASTQTADTCSGGNSVCSLVVPTRTCAATSSCPASGGGGGGGSFGPTVGNYTLPSSASDRLVDTFDNIDLKKVKEGILTRPLKMKELGGKYFVEIEKGTKIADEKGNAFSGKILAPVKILTSKLPKVNTKTREISKGKYALRAIKVGLEKGSIYFDKDIKITMSLSGISKKLNRYFVNIYSYNEDLGIYQIENKNRIYNEKDDSIAVSVHYMKNFIAVWENGGYKGGTGGGFEEAPEKGGICKIKDISNHWSKDFVTTLCDKGVVSGEGDTGLFKPNNSINRAALLKMLMVSFGYKIDSTFSEKYFQDVNGDEWFANYVNTARKMGFIEGYKIKKNILIKHKLQEKSYGEEVLILQNFLTKKGFYDYTITGYFGGLTKLALQKYQQSVGIMTTGNLGPKTLAKVNSELNIGAGDVYDFKPASFINRAEALAMILKVAKKSVGNNYGDFAEFKDVSSDQWFANYVKYGFENGIISGKSKGIFSPSGNITKGEVAKIILKTMNLK